MALNGGRVTFADVTSILSVVPGGTRTVLATQAPGVATLTADAVSVYWIPGPLPKGPLLCWGGCDAGAASPVPDGIFAVAWTGGTVHTVSTSGEALQHLRAWNGALWGLGQDETTASSLLQRVDIATGSFTLVAAAGVIPAFAVDDSGVYWTSGGSLLTTPL
jgi:hypothetical protein